MKLEQSLRVLILLVVGGIAGAAAFTHVHDWTMAHSPAGTSDAFGWANAVITELLPVGALLEVRRRKRNGQSLVFPALLLVAFALVSLTAQVSQAEQSVFGWFVAALPALAFMALVKQTLSGEPAGQSGGQHDGQGREQATDDGRPVTLYRLVGESGRPLYIGITNHLQSRLVVHRRRAWWPEVVDIQTVDFETRAAAMEAEARAITAECPRYNVQHGFAPPVRDDEQLSPTPAQTAVQVGAPRSQRDPKKAPARALRSVRADKSADKGAEFREWVATLEELPSNNQVRQRLSCGHATAARFLEQAERDRAADRAGVAV